LPCFGYYTTHMTRREFFAMGAVGLAAGLVASVTPFRVRMEANILSVRGPLHGLCRVHIGSRQILPLRRSWWSSDFELDIPMDLAPVTVQVSGPFSFLDWSMVIHPFEPGF
jgi:hypothetical protein